MFELPPMKLWSFGNLHLNYISRENFFIASCAGRRVLHIGCTSMPYTQQRLDRGTHLHKLLLGVTKELYGIDLSKEGIDIMKKHLNCDNLYVGDAERLDEISLDKKDFDVILAGDVLEHLNNPGLFLKGIRRFMMPNTRLIISTNNAFSLPNFIRLTVKGFREGTGHVMVNSPATLTNLLDRHGLKIKQIFTGYQKQPNGLAKKAIFCVGKLIFQAFPALGGTLIIVSRLADSNE